MPRTAPSIPHVADWIATLSRSKALQYGPSVNSFFSKRGDFDAASVERDELVDYCAGIKSKTQARACRALDEFFGYLDDEGKIPKHPAPRLANRVHKALKRRELERQLLDGGMLAPAVASLRWRDVMFEIASPANGLPPSVPEPTLDRLVDELLERLRGASSSTVAAVLDANVLS